MRPTATLFGLVYAIGGGIFALNSAPRGGDETHWGYALSGIVCLIIGAKFLGLPSNRDAYPGKLGKIDPLD